MAVVACTFSLSANVEANDVDDNEVGTSGIEVEVIITTVVVVVDLLDEEERTGTGTGTGMVLSLLLLLLLLLGNSVVVKLLEEDDDPDDVEDDDDKEGERVDERAMVGVRGVEGMGVTDKLMIWMGFAVGSSFFLPCFVE